jgi:hypothetical protein
MKKKKILGVFIGVHIAFIFLQIYKQSYLVQLTYEKQHHEKVKQELLEKKNHLTQQWYILQNRSAIKEYAQQELGMKKVALKQIKKIA